MATRYCTPEGTLRCLGSLRSIFVCILLVLLVAGAASYTQGSRYSLVGHGPFLSAPAETAGSGAPLAQAPLLEATPAGQDAPPSSDSPVVPVTHHAGARCWTPGPWSVTAVNAGRPRAASRPR